MLSRIIFIFIGLFWVTMNVLLWRSEYGTQRAVGSPVPVELVWKKMLTAPDSSTLNIMQRGQKIGFCRWTTSVSEELATLDEAPSEGMVASKMTSYRIHFDGNATLQKPELRGRFDLDLKLSGLNQWREFTLTIRSRPYFFEIKSLESEQKVKLRTEDPEGRMDYSFKFSELQHPQALLAEFAGPLGGALVGSMQLPEATQKDPTSFLKDLKLEARNDTITIGHEPVRVYRLETHVLGRYDIVIYVSRVGEILRAELPDGIQLTHYKLSGS